MKNILFCFLAAFAFLSPMARAVTSITQYNITWTFDKDYPSGQFCNGDYWVVGPLKIVGITNDLHAPGFTAEPGLDGTMVNPGTDAKQGYDNRLKSYDESLNAALINKQPVSATNPLEIKADSSVISTVSWLIHSATDVEPGCPKFNSGTNEPRPVTHAAAVLTVLLKAPPAGSFRPPYVGTDKTIKYNVSQLDLSKLKNLKPVADTPEVGAMEKSVERPWIDHVNEFLGAMVHPSSNMPQYGRELGYATADATLMLNLDFSQLPGKPTKNKLAIGYAQLGIDLTGIADDGGYWPANGGHAIGRKLPILVTGIMLNDPHMKDVGQWKTRFQDDEQTFYVSQAEVDITHSPKWVPDKRNIAKTAYETKDIGMPEWGILHAKLPEHDDADWDAVYRSTNGPVIVSTAAAIHIMGLEDAWNHKAFLDYANRYYDKSGDKKHSGVLPKFDHEMWDAYAAAPAKPDAGAAKAP